MPAARVSYQTSTTEYNFSPRTTGTLTAPASGNTWLVMVGVGVPAVDRPSITLSDNQGNTYTEDTTFSDRLSSEITDKLFRCNNITNAPTTLSATWTGGAQAIATFYVYEISGLTAGAPLRVSTKSEAFSADTSTSYTTTLANEFCLLGLGGPQPFASLVGGVSSDVANQLHVADTGVVGSKTYGAILTANNGWSQKAVFYQSSVGGGGSGFARTVMLH